jgi:hypothetical protein
MRNWVGNAASGQLLAYTPLFPFFDTAFVTAAMATPAEDKLNSRAAYRLLSALDPELARRPLADGTVPSTAPHSRLAKRIADVKLDAGRVFKRLSGQMTGAHRRTLGSQTVAQHWHRLALYEHLPLERISRSGLINDQALERIASGRWLPDRPTLGFLLLVAALETRN